jgi:hypothetical protein
LLVESLDGEPAGVTEEDGEPTGVALPAGEAVGVGVGAGRRERYVVPTNVVIWAPSAEASPTLAHPPFSSARWNQRASSEFAF